MTPTDEDRELFRKAVADARPLPEGKNPPVRRSPPPRAVFRRADESAVLEESLEANPEAESGTGEDLSFRRPSISTTVLRRLRRGEYSVRDEIDLHGFTAAEARAVLYEFLSEAYAAGARCVKVIHGKGRGSGHQGPVIKRKLGRWLQMRADVQAYCSARPVDGGTGAIYVLLDSRNGPR